MRSIRNMVPHGIVPVYGLGDINIRSALGGYIVSAPGSSALYAPVEEEMIFVADQLEDAIAYFLKRVNEAPLDSVMQVGRSSMGDSPLMSASEKAVVGVRYSNGHVMTLFRRPTSPEDARQSIVTRVFSDATVPTVASAIFSFFAGKGVEEKDE